jgi:hypothetical protein
MVRSLLKGSNVDLISADVLATAGFGDPAGHGTADRWYRRVD